MDIMRMENVPYDLKLNYIYSKMVELTDGEEDEELKQYNEYLLDCLQELIGYFHNKSINTEENEKDKFIRACENVGVEAVPIKTHVTPDVYNYLNYMADKNDCNLYELLRDMIDYMIENDTD